MANTCADCKFYSEDPDMNSRIPPNHPRRELMVRGQCHRFPPQGDGRGRREATTMVSSSYWCGEWTSKP